MRNFTTNKRVAMKKQENYIPTEEERNALRWCVNNHIKVYVKPRNNSFILVYVIDGVASTSGKKYHKDEIYLNQWGFYLYLYKKFYNV